MAKRIQRRFSRVRRIFRWCRILFLLLVLAVVVSGIYLNTIGLPGFLKNPLIARLKEAGVEVEFGRMRLRWYRGVVVDHATFTFLKHPLQPIFFSDETELNPDLRSLSGPHLKLNSLAIKNGTLVWPVSKTNSGSLTLSNITTRVRFHSKEEIDVERFAASFANAQITINGSLTNAAAIRDWKLFQKCFYLMCK